MQPLQRTKAVIVTSPAAIVDNAAFTTNEIDTKGFNSLTIYMVIGATDIAMAALSVTESDTSGSGHAAITELVVGTADNSAGTTSSLPDADEDDTIHVFDIDLRGRKRYIDLVATAGDGTAGTFMSAIAILSKADNEPTDAAGRGASQLMQV